MRFVTREEFLALPSHTLFSKVNENLDIGTLCVKGDTIGGVDFQVIHLNDTLEADDNGDSFDCLLRMNQGESVPVDLLEGWGRDGMFNDSMFAVWEEQDVRQLVKLAGLCLNSLERQEKAKCLNNRYAHSAECIPTKT